MNMLCRVLSLKVRSLTKKCHSLGYTEYLTWMRFNNTFETPTDTPLRRKRLDEFALPDDVSNSLPPFKTKSGRSATKSEEDDQMQWKDMVLGVNPITQTVWPLFHMTGDKGFRDRWWPKMWFHPHAEKLLAANSISLAGKDAALVAEVAGIRWTGANTSRLSASTYTSWGGAWTDQGDYLGWKKMCGQYEKQLFVNRTE